MRVSVVIPCYNYGRYLGAAIASALQQTLPPYEVIVVDDGSTDDTQAVVAQFGDRVRYHYQANAGISAARNAALRLARGDLIALLDADDLWLPGKLARQVPLFAAEPALGAVYSRYRRCAPDGRVLRTLYGGPWSGWIFSHLLRRNFLGTSTVVLRRRAVDQVGEFDESLAGSEDWDYWLRVAARFPIGFVPAPLACHRLHPHSASQDPHRMNQADLQLLAKVYADPLMRPQIADPYRRLLALRRMRAGYRYRHAGRTGPACRELLRALALWPFERELYEEIAAALVRSVWGPPALGDGRGERVVTSAPAERSGGARRSVRSPR